MWVMYFNGHEFLIKWSLGSHRSLHLTIVLRFPIYVSRRVYVTWMLADCNHVFITVYPKKYAHGFVVLCFVVVMQLFTMNTHEVFIHIHQGCFAGTGAIVRLWQHLASNRSMIRKFSKSHDLCMFRFFISAKLCFCCGFIWWFYL